MNYNSCESCKALDCEYKALDCEYNDEGFCRCCDDHSGYLRNADLGEECAYYIPENINVKEK